MPSRHQIRIGKKQKLAAYEVYMAMDIMETPEPTATPMPMRAPREMMEREV